MNADKSIQEGELDALKSIYFPEEFQVISSDKETSAIFFAFLQLPDNYTVKYKETLESAEFSYLKVKYLPPIELLLTLRENYPSKDPPDFVIRCQWLRKKDLSLLCKKLDDIWSENPNVEVIYTFCEFLKNDVLSFLNIEECLDITKLNENYLNYMKRKKEQGQLNGGNNSKSEEVKNPLEAVKPSSNGKLYSNRMIENNDNVRKCYIKGDRYNKKYYGNQRGKSRRNEQGKYKRKSYDRRAVISKLISTSPVELLEHYNSERDMVEFARNCYSCNVCFMDKLGKDCMKFNPCEHVFCKTCIRDYFTVKINDGSVEKIKCPEPKCLSEALPSQVKEMVSEELFAKYDSILLNKALDCSNDVIYCPRSFCQYPVIREPEEQLASCPQCKYVFCVFCKMVYHGVEPCKLKSEEKQKLIKKYMEASGEGKLELELRYGKKQLQTMVNNSMAEDWIKTNSKPCPSCSAAIEKSQGCNKMVCWKCNAFFCWLCEGELDPVNPYFHYNDPNSRCNNKLFHLVVPEEEPEEWEDWDWVEESEDEDFIDADHFGVPYL